MNFAPTFKYDDHSDTYDTSKKNRTPAWCDRILIEKIDKGGRDFKLLEYDRRENLFSDHRPVVGIYQLKVCEINKEFKD